MVDWPMALFLDPQRATIVKRNVPRQIQSVSNYKVIGKNRFVSQVTGGVLIDPWEVLRHNEYRKDSGGALKPPVKRPMTTRAPEEHRWWWD